MADKAKATAPTPPAKSGKGRLIIFGLVFVVIGVGGGGAAAYFTMRKSAAQDSGAHGSAHASAKEKPKPTKLMSLEPFVVNLADPGGSRFLRVTLRLIVAAEGDEEEAGGHGAAPKGGDVAMERVRSSILEVLTQQTADHLVTAEGKEALKEVIAEHAEKALDGTKVTDVLFSDFVVQF
jgi:flagellar FliL protein